MLCGALPVRSGVLLLLQVRSDESDSDAEQPVRVPKNANESPMGPGDPPSDLQTSRGSDDSSDDMSDEVCRKYTIYCR